MLSFIPATGVFLVAGITDLRKSFDTLGAIVSNELHKDPLGGELFVFCNRRRDRVKILFFDHGGLWVCAKRLERGTFSWPEAGGKTIEMTAEELALLLGGIDAREKKARRWYRPERGKGIKSASTG